MVIEIDKKEDKRKFFDKGKDLTLLDIGERIELKFNQHFLLVIHRYSTFYENVKLKNRSSVNGSD